LAANSKRPKLYPMF